MTSATRSPAPRADRPRQMSATPAEAERLSVSDYVRALPRSRQLAVLFASAALVLANFLRFGPSGHALVGAILAVALVLLTAIDLDRRLLPDVIVLPTLAIVLVLQVAFYPHQTLEWMVASVSAALFFFIPMLVYPPGMGMGDVKLAGLLGAALGRAVAAAIVAALLAAGAVALFILVREGFGARKKGLPFGPFLAFGGLLVLFVGAR
jgi:leader peptidase (prepilin peptidase) / N-methyltransferase